MTPKPQHAAFYFRLSRKRTLPQSQVGKRMLQDPAFHYLVENGTLQRERIRGGYRFTVQAPDKYQRFLANNFPQGDPSLRPKPQDSIEGHARYGNSKVARGKSRNPIVFLRGYKSIQVNGQTVDLVHHTQHFKVFATVLQELRTPKVCFVENKAPFLHAEALIPQDYVFVHTYGRIGKGVLEKLHTSEVLVFSDYDFIGLNEYLHCKQHNAHTTFYMPANYDALRKQYPTPLRKTKQGRSQKPSQQVKESMDPLVCHLRKHLATTNHFLEQEALFHHAL